MKTKVAGVLLACCIAAGYYAWQRPAHSIPGDLRDAVAGDSAVDVLKTASDMEYSDVSIPEPVTSSRVEAGAPSRALVRVDNLIPGETADKIKAALYAYAGKIDSLPSEWEIGFEARPHFGGINPRVFIVYRGYHRLFYLHEAKQIRYEVAPAREKARLLFEKRDVDPREMDIAEQVEAVLDIAGYISAR